MLSIRPPGGKQKPMAYTYSQIAKMIDHSLLNQVLTDQELEAGCRLARDYDVASVCIKPYYCKRCAELLAGSTVAASTVIGFPHGGNTTARDRCGFREDVHRVRQRRRYNRRSEVDARAFAAAHSRQSGRWSAHVGRTARGSLYRCRQGGRDADGQDAGRV